MVVVKFGVEDAHWSILRNLLIQPLTESGCAVFIFGSRARGDYKKFSDLDILVEGNAKSSLLSSISEQLEESNLPFRVDLVIASDLADAYKPSVERDKVKIS
jgi:predicted nucleotidyltransferase